MNLYERINAGEFANKLPYATAKYDLYKWTAYKNEERRLYDLFRTEALKEVGLENHAKAYLIFGKAWERGHSAGLYEVLICLDDLAEFVRDLESPC